MRREVFRWVGTILEPSASLCLSHQARPGGNLTGLSFAQGENFSGKWLSLVRDIAPKATRVGVIWNRANLANVAHVKEMEALAPGLGLTLSSHVVQSLESVDAAFAALTGARVAALIVETDPTTVALRGQILRLVAARRLPTIFSARLFVEGGA